MTISRKGAREKGKQAERDIAKALNGIGIEAKRVPMSGALSWMKGDIVEFNTDPKHVHEIKNQETLVLNDWWGQATEQVKGGEIPVLHFTSNYKPFYTMLTSETFDELLYTYESTRHELKLKVVDIPPRKNFWKFNTTHDKLTIFMYQEQVILMFDLYLMLRRCSVTS